MEQKRNPYCRLCYNGVDEETKIEMEKIVVHRPYKIKERFFKCHSCGATFTFRNIIEPIK